MNITTALIYAAPDFLRRLRHRAEHDALTTKDICTLKKYLIRMTFRSTPFGLFTAIAPLTCGTENNVCSVPEQHQVFFSRKNAIALQTIPDIIYLNPTLYISGNKIRYLKQIWQGTQASYKLNEIELEDDFSTLLSRIGTQTNLDELEQIIRDISPQTSEQEIHIYIQQLIEYGVFSHSDHLQLTPSPIEMQLTLAEVHHRTRMQHSAITHDHFINLRAQLRENTLSTSQLEQLRKDLYYLDSLTYPHKLKSCEAFKQEFIRRYENNTVPLLEVLDIDHGITTFGSSIVQSELLYSIKLLRKAESPDTIQFKASLLDDYIVQQLTSAKSGILTHIDLAECIPPAEQLPTHCYASSAGLLVNLFTDANNELLVNYCGSYGPTATLWLSRFNAMLDHDSQQALMDYATTEQTLNPELVYAEVLYIEKLQQSDVIRRPTLYHYEIPLFVRPSVAPEFVIMPEDLMIYLDNDEICLYSRRLQKRVIPRISSAHAYQHQQLNLYHFFGILQNQNARTPAFQLPALLTQLHYVPRIQYRNIILQKKRWLLLADDIAELTNCPAKKRQTLLQKFSLDRYVSFGEADQVMRLDLLSDIDLQILQQHYQTKFELYESLADQYTSVVQCNNGMHYSNEIVIATNPLEKAFQPKPAPLSIYTQRPSVLPASTNELYLKIYASITTQESILNSAELQQIIATYHDYSVFFVRYTDPRPHLRLRLLRQTAANLPLDCNWILSLLHQIQPGNTEIEIAAYKREVSRYGGNAGIQFAETVFSADSKDLLRMYSQQQLATESDRMCRAMMVLSQILGLQTSSNAVKARLCHDTFNAYLNEYENKKNILHHLSALYRRHKDQIVQHLIPTNFETASNGVNKHPTRSLTIELENYYRYLTIHCADKAPTILGAVFHMQCNRVFVQYGRELEMLCYGLAYKCFNALAAQERQH